MLTAGITFKKFGNRPLYSPLGPSSLTIVRNVSIIPKDLRSLNDDVSTGTVTPAALTGLAAKKERDIRK
jgi:hypothetical protein